MKKIPLSKPAGLILPEGNIISDEESDKLIAQSRWCPGVALMNEHKVPCDRLKTLDGYLYRVNGQLTEHADAFSPSEYLPWRDGTISDDQI
jgi:hypothetical protein